MGLDKSRYIEQIKFHRRCLQYLKQFDDVYDKPYFEKHYKKYRDWEIKIGESLVKYFNVQSLVDFGCGCGSYLEGAKKAGVERVLGLELQHKLIQEIVPEEVSSFIREADIMQEIKLKERFDCSMSIEVLEHILPGKEGQVLDNLINNASRLVLLTAAPPEQKGTSHINAREKQFWIDIMKEKGCKLLEEDTRILANQWKTFLKSKYYYVPNNLMIFEL